MSALWSSMLEAGLSDAAGIQTPDGEVAYRSLQSRSLLPDLEPLRGRHVALACRDPLTAALAIMELDGVAARLLLCTPDLTPAQIATAAAAASSEWLLHDALTRLEDLPQMELAAAPCHPAAARRATHLTEWILMTSGTSGTPKLVRHTFQSLAGALPRRATSTAAPVWSTFYDIRRYGGLQILLRAALLGCPLVLTGPHEAIGDFLVRAGRTGVTHISGTPSHWRRALMSGVAEGFAPRYVRLSGEAADQAVLDNLRRAFPGAGVAHAFASTEAGVAFEVTDGRAGFPVAWLEGLPSGVELQAIDGTLRIRSARTALDYLGSGGLLRDAQGWVDTGDLIEMQGERYLFRGRRGGIINIGGLKVFPEEVEQVLNGDPRVKLSRVTARRSPITGALVAAEVVLAPATAPTQELQGQVRNELLERCRSSLAPHKVPASLKFVDTLPVSAAGKLLRQDA